MISVPLKRDICIQIVIGKWKENYTVIWNEKIGILVGKINKITQFLLVDVGQIERWKDMTGSSFILHNYIRLKESTIENVTILIIHCNKRHVRYV